MTSVIRLTFLTIGVLLLKEISCASLKKPQETPPSKGPESHGLPALPGRPDLPYLPALTERPDLPWLPRLPENMSMPIIPENRNLSSLPSLPTTPGFPTLSTYPTSPTLPTWPTPSSPTTRTLSHKTKFATTKPSVIITTSISSNSRPTRSTTLTPKTTKPCCSGKTHETTRYTKKHHISTKIYNTTEKTASTAVNLTDSTLIGTGISSSSTVTVTPEILTTVTSDSSTRISPETKPIDILTTLSPTTIISESSTVSTSGTSAETAETSITSFLETEVPRNPSSSISTADAFETSFFTTEASETVSTTETFSTSDASKKFNTSLSTLDASETFYPSLKTTDATEKSTASKTSSLPFKTTQTYQTSIKSCTTIPSDTLTFKTTEASETLIPSLTTTEEQTTTEMSEKSLRTTDESETSTASFTTIEASDITSLTDTNAPEISMTSFSTTDALETGSTLFSSRSDPETSTTSLLLVTKDPEVLTTLLPTIEASETLKTSFPATDISDTSTRVTVTPEDDKASVADTTKLDVHEISTTTFSTAEAAETSTTSFPVTESLTNPTRVTESQQDENTNSGVVDPSKLCPNNQSLISERDLETIAKYKIENLSLAELLNNSFYTETVALKDKIKDELQQFLIWFEDRPAHLKHILEHLTKIRSKLEKNVNHQSDKLQEYTVLQNEYNIKYERLQKLGKKVENYKHVCKLNCEEAFASDHRRSANKTTSSSSWPWKTIDEPEAHQPDERNNLNMIVSVILDRPEEGGLQEIPTKYTGGGKYYCSNIDALVHRIKNILLHNLDISKNDFKHKIIEDSKLLQEKIEDLKKKLKSIALAQFGSSMYDILNLQDQYYHFDELLKTDVHHYIVQTKKQFTVFEALIMDLEVRAEKLKKYCTTCSVAVRHHVKETDLVDYVIDKMYNNVLEEASNNYNKIICELEPNFKEWEFSDEKIANLKPIQEEIARMTVKETEELNKLKEAFPKSSIANAVELEQKVKELNEKANLMEIELIEKYNM